MKQEVLWFQEAVDQLFDLSSRQPRQASRILLTVRSYGRDGRGDLKKLSGTSDEWRLRSGDWRVFCVMDGSRVYVTGIDNRRDAYR